MNDNHAADAARSYLAPLAGANYVVLTTFRRDGRAVPTPVHLVVSGDAGYLRTWDVSGKAKRLRHTPRVTVAPSTMRGRPTGPMICRPVRDARSG